MRAATIRDGKLVVAEHPDPQPGAGDDDVGEEHPEAEHHDPQGGQGVETREWW